MIANNGENQKEILNIAMDLDFSTREKIVGMFIICIAILLLATVIIIGRGKDWFKAYIPYYTTMDESYNLQKNTSVKLFNTDIGKVEAITLVGDKVKVDLLILEKFQSRIRSDALITIKSPTLIGSEYISIIPGRKDAPIIPHGGLIPSRPKKSIADYLDEFEVEKTGKMLIDAIQDISDIVKTIRDPQGPLFTTLDHANNTLASIDKITSDIESGKGTVGGILKSRALLDHIHKNLNLLGENLATLKKIENGVLESIPEIKKIVIGLQDAVKMVKTILTNIEKGSHDIPKVTQTTTKGIEEIRDAVESIDKVVQSLQKNFLIKPYLPEEPEAKNVDAGLRP
ncbi:MAG: MCE family protein [Desulfobacterales bacterium]|nr:MAG: MCE family protein [Desulfobacterales bacterium]UCD88577.1 MAG: MCE family protein [Desulfobacterales bacterium]